MSSYNNKIGIYRQICYNLKQVIWMKKKKKKKFYQYFNIFLLIMGIVFLILLYFTNVLSLLYFSIISGVLFILTMFLIGNINHKHLWALFLGMILLVIEVVGCIYLNKTNSFLDRIHTKTEIEAYKVVVLNSLDATVSDLKEIGILKNTDEGYTKAVEEIEEKINKTVTFDDVSSLTSALLMEKIPAILIDNATDTVLRENDTRYASNTKSIYDYEITVKTNVKEKNMDITKNTFSIYISGVDTYNKIATKTRSDVNIVLTVNPVTKKIVMSHIPRDYYVTLAGKNSKDKLTHASLYGIDTAMKTVENFTGVKIDYYVRLNFTSLIKIVDLLGGIDVNSKYAFETGIYDSTMKKTYKFKKGLNHLDGDAALSFVRERHSFADGDITRGENQMIVLEALIKKAMSPKIITSYTKFLDVLDDAMITNMTKKEITDFIKKEISKPSSYEIESVSLNGTSALDYTFSYPMSKLYVMVPDEQLLNDYKEKVNALY